MSVKLLQVLSLFLFAAAIFGCETEATEHIKYRAKNEVNIIPQVSHLAIENGAFKLSKETVILVWNDTTTGAKYLKSIIDSVSNFSIPIIKIEKEDFKKYGNYIMLNNQSKTLEVEHYNLLIDSTKVAVSAMTNKGVMNGIQTLRQLFVSEFHNGIKRDSWYLPHVKIEDSPKFKHRGLLLDCSRHFFNKAIVKKYIDLLALYKMNVLHWHLTEDQGWRIEIDAYPKLTEIGAWRTEYDGSRYGGFYTKKDIREIVAYAAEREVTVIPEIELPGHSQAAIAAYQHLSCTGEKVEVANDWGVFKEIYCAGNDSVFIFLETVLDEVLALFPSKYIHIGGDEAPKFRWENCDKCQKRMVNNDLKDEHELQSYFINRIEMYLNAKGRQLIGWDEILEGGLSKNATVQSWRGMEGGIAAAKSKHDAIMSPTSHAYLDYDLKAIDLEKVYSFNPVPADLTEEEAKYIIGGEVNMWTEHVPNDSVLDSKVFPRLLAMSEVLWSSLESRDYNDFYNRVQGHYPILKAMDVNYGAEGVPVSINISMENSEIIIDAVPLNENLILKYRWQNDTSTAYLLFENALKVNKSGTIEFQAFKDTNAYGLAVKQHIEVHKALGAEATYKTTYSQWYEAGKKMALTDGKIGSLDFRDGCWQGFWGDNVSVEIDLGAIQNISTIETHFYQYNNSWIFMPTEVLFEGSIDGQNYFEMGKISAKTDPKTRGKSIEKFLVSKDPTEVRYVKLVAKNMGKVPKWHEAAGSDAWLFIDEIVIK